MTVQSPDIRDSDLELPELRRTLEETWRSRHGLIGFLSVVDHKIIARRYILTALMFLGLGGLAAVAMRIQLAVPENTFLNPDLYNQFFTMHGTTMMFLFAVPIMEAFAVYLVPLMIGARTVAFPRLNAFSYWVYLFGGVMIWVAFAFNTGADAGWFAYVPLSGPEFSPGKRTDFWAQMITYTEVAGLAVAVVTITTVFKMRAPGMSLNRMPLFVWAEMITAFLVCFAMPAVMVASTMLILDRLVATHFFNPAEGGHPLLWQHLFWFFGHPEVYIIFLPATGMVSSIVPAFARRPIVGYPLIVMALLGNGFLSFGLWVHHMFATGLPQMGYSFFTGASMVIAIPSGIQIFCWIATLWLGRPIYRTPLLFVLGFIAIFVAGGLSGVMLAAVPIDIQVHDTYFVVAHFHYVLVGGAVFPLLGAIYYWYPKVTGRMMSETLGRWHFAVAFISFNAAFFPMHILGLMGMTRRIYTYAPETQWGPLNLFVSISALVFAVSFLMLAINMWRSWFKGERAGPNPWEASTLEWAADSPPAPYNFARLPVISDRDPLWKGHGRPQGEVVGLKVHVREALVTTAMEAKPDLRESSPADSIWPFLAAIAVGITFLWSIFTPWAVVWGAAPVGITLIGWFWPKGSPEDE